MSAAAVCSGSKRNTCQVSLNSLTSGKVVINFRNEVSDLFSVEWTVYIHSWHYGRQCQGIFAARSLPNFLLHVCVATRIAQKILVESSRL